MIGFLLRLPGRIAVLALTAVVRLYQRLVSPLIGPHCRFEPSCSEYLCWRLPNMGRCGASAKGLWRILRCNPWCDGGLDPP